MFMNRVFSIEEIQDGFFSKEGFLPINVYDEIVKGNEPKSPLVMLVTVKHWFFFKKKYLILPNAFTQDVILCLDDKTQTAERIALNNDKFSFVLRLSLAAHSMKMLEVVKKAYSDIENGKVKPQEDNVVPFVRPK